MAAPGTAPNIEILVLPSGDRAEAETPEDALYAARTLLHEAREHGAAHPTAAFYVAGRLVRYGVTRVDLAAWSLA